ncbi:MAG: UbiD family decarboxylase [Desulfobacterota bacterium]|nr:UbiD family decarboxylase [Thermodesulfobacteriota bacterium]
MISSGASLRPISGLGDFLDALRSQGDLLSIKLPLDPRYEISAVLSELGKRDSPAILFERVKGHRVPVVGNLLGTKRRLALALRAEPETLFEEFLKRLGQEIPPVLVREETPKEVIKRGKGLDLRRLLPILTHYEDDSGPYITSGVSSARDPETGAMGRGLHRMELRGKDRLGISLLNPPLSEIYEKYKKRRRKMEIATAIGLDPLIFIAPILKAPPGMDKLALVGGLIGRAIETVKAETVDLEIPARAEIVIEGVIDPMGKEEDGVLGESSGYYMGFSRSPSIEVTALTLKKGAFYHAIVPWSLEVDNLLYLVHGLDFVPKMKREVPAIREIRFVPGTFGSHAVISIETDSRAEVRRALALALSFPHIKKAVAVNPDIDLHSNQEIEWALATRFQADRDLMVLTEMRGQPIDPSAGEGFFTAKMGLDATRPRPEGFKKVDVPEEVKRRLSPLLHDLKAKGMR